MSTFLDEIRSVVVDDFCSRSSLPPISEEISPMAKAPVQTKPAAPTVTSPPQGPKGFLDEEPGRKSAMRAMSFCALLAAIVFAALTLVHPVASQGGNGIYITFGFLLAAFAPKALQKYAEKAP